MTVVVNIKKEKCDVICDRRSIFGNPYKIGRDGTRDEVVEKYRVLFYKKIKNGKFKKEVFKIKDKRIGCWCVPLNCHLNVIAEYLNNESK